MSDNSFRCRNCDYQVSNSNLIGTAHRNHCPSCLFSLDVDLEPGDRKSQCQGIMEPIGLTFKKEGEKDKYGKARQGELMLIHECLRCNKISINRIAGDDKPKTIIDLFEKSQKIDFHKKKLLEESNINLLREGDREEVERQLFGKNK